MNTYTTTSGNSAALARSASELINSLADDKASSKERMATQTGFETSVPGTPGKKSFTRHLPTVARILLGLPLVIFGLNSFLNFIPPPATVLPAGAAAFAEALVNTGYMMQLIGATHLIVGILLLSNRFVPLALALFAPFMVNSIAFHLALEHSGLPMAIIFLAVELYLAWSYRSAYRPMLSARTKIG